VRLSVRRAALAALVTCCGAVGLWAGPAHASTIFYVGDLSTPGNVTLATAIGRANSTPGIDTILFRYPGADNVVHVIAPTSDLPVITDPVVIDGYSQTGAAPATATSPAKLRIVIDGGNLNAGLIVQANGSTISGLVVHNVAGTGDACSGVGICVLGRRDTVSGNYVGVDYAGAMAMPNRGAGILVGNSNNVIGGGDPAARNVISGNDGDGIEVGASANGNQILGNWIGTNVDRTVRLPNAIGVELHSDNNTVGGTDPDAANILTGNRVAGLRIDAPGNTNTVEGNLIGAVPGVAAWGNQGDGVVLASNLPNAVGGTLAGEGNTIAGNGGKGIVVESNSAGNPILGNLIYGNAGIGIDLNDNGISMNDPQDTDLGANDTQNFPTGLGAWASTDRVAWSLYTTTGVTLRFRLEFFTGTTCGDAETFVGSADAVTDPVTGEDNGTAPLTVPISTSTVITATATEVLGPGVYGSTSELSYPCGPVLP
jgi:hypothetical protein